MKDHTNKQLVKILITADGKGRDVKMQALKEMSRRCAELGEYCVVCTQK